MGATSTLWEIGDRLLAVEAAIAEADGAITPEIEATLDELEGSFFDKVERVALFIEERAGDAAKAKAQEDRLRGIRKAHESTVASLRDYLERCMARAGVDKVERPTCRVRRYRNTQPAVSCSTAEIPAAFARVIPEQVELDRAAVIAAVKEGAPLPDGIEVAYGYHVRIL